MPRIFHWALVVACVAAPLRAPAGTPPSSLRAKLDQYMDAAAKVEHFMGSVLVARGDQVILARGYGMANLASGTPNAPDTEFRIGSNTKQFTAMAILMLQAEGKLDVHDPVCKFVPQCPADWRPITLYNLLTHTSGIPDFTDFPSYPKIRPQTMTPTRLVALFKDKPLKFKTGARFSYSNSGYVLLGYIIERVSGESYQQFLQQHIFGPLGMHDSGYDQSHPVAKNHAAGYRVADGKYEPAVFVNMTVPFSAGALYSTVRDLYTWDQALEANTGKLIPPSLHTEMFAPHVPVDDGITKVDPEAGAMHYGYGWFINRQFGHLEYSHEGGIAGFTSLNSWFPDEHVYIIVLDNMTSPEIFQIGNSLAAIVFGQPYTLPQPFKAITLPAKDLARFVGTYRMAPKMDITITRDGDQLMSRMTGQPAVAIYPESPTRFFLKVVRAEILFQVNGKGQVTGLAVHQNGRDMPASKVH